MKQGTFAGYIQQHRRKDLLDGDDIKLTKFPSS